RLSRRSTAMARVTAGTARTRGVRSMAMIVHIQCTMLLYNHRQFAIIGPVAKLTDFTRYADAQARFSPDKLWELFDGDRLRLNIAHECIDRHVARSDPAVIVVHADGSDEVVSFADIAQGSARFAHWLAAQGVGPGDRVAIMLEPSRAFYVALFGTLKRGAI